MPCFDAMMENKRLIVTIIIGNYDVPCDNFEHVDGYDYILLTDRPIKTKSWKNIIADFKTGGYLSNTKKQRYLKTHLFEKFKDYDLVAYVDGNININDDLYEYIEENKDYSITFKKHPIRDCIYDEIRTCFSISKETKEICQIAYFRYSKEGYPKKNGLFETNIILFKPKADRIDILFNDWWKEIFRFSKRDQFSLNYVIWKNKLDDIVNVAKSDKFKSSRHKKIKN